MEKSILLISKDEGFSAKVAEIIRSKGFIFVVVNNMLDAYEALRRAYYDLVLVDSNVGPGLLVREFTNRLFELNQGVLVFVSRTFPDWVGLEAPLILRALVEVQLPDWMEKNG